MKRSGTKRLVAACLFLAALCGGIPSARADAWRDDKLGYSFSAPPRWTVVPVDPDGWLVAKFACNREYEWTDPKNNIWTRQRPQIEVVVIPYALKDIKGVTVEKSEEGTKVVRPVPWKNLKEYLDRTLQDRRVGGFHFSAEDETTIGGLKVRRYEITVDKDVEGERRVYGWEFAAEDTFYGMVCEILAKEEKGLKPDLFQAFGSFRTFPRTGKLPGTATEGDTVATVKDTTKPAKDATPEELRKKRDDATARTLARLKESLGKDWSVVEGKNFVAVSHADAKYTHELLAHAEALRAWLEGQFGFVGSGYAGRIILRIFASNQEYSSYSESRVWSRDVPEVATFKDKEGWLDWHMDGLNRGIYDIWLRDKNERLSWGLPEWLRWGLPDYIERAKSKAGKVEFKADIWDSVEMKTLRRSDKLQPARSFFQLTSEELWNQDRMPTQTQFFVNFLLAGAASRSPKYRNLLTDYMKSLIFLLDAEDLGGSEGAVKAPANEAEEAAMNRRFQDAWRQREQDTLKKLFDKVFGSWTDRDWDAFEALYRQDLK